MSRLTELQLITLLLSSFSVSQRLLDSKIKLGSCTKALATTYPPLNQGVIQTLAMVKGGLLLNKAVAPPPGSYEPLTQFAKTPKGKAFSFGLPYSTYSKVYSEIDKSPDKAVPGPGTYDIPQICGNEGLKYTLKPRLSNSMLKYAAGIPGPGTYEAPQTISKTGIYFNSKFRNSRAGVFSPSRSQRFISYNKDDVRNVPGPGTYNPSASITKDGNYFVSKFQSSMCRTFYHFNRETMSGARKTKGIPGPGSYRLPSDFGY